MAEIVYTIHVHNEYEQQEFTTSGGTEGIVSEADMDSAVQAFANALVSGTTSAYPLTLDAVYKTTTTTTVDRVTL